MTLCYIMLKFFIHSQFFQSKSLHWCLMYSRSLKEPSVPLSGDLHSIKTGKRLQLASLPQSLCLSSSRQPGLLQGSWNGAGDPVTGWYQLPGNDHQYFVHFAKEGNVRFPILLIKHLTSILNAWPYFLRFNVKYIRHRSKVWGQWDFYVVAEIKQIFYSTSMHYILIKSIILQNNI